MTFGRKENKMKKEVELSLEWSWEHADSVETDRSHVASISNGMRSIHIMVVNGDPKPRFVLADDEGAEIMPTYETFYLARLAAEGWLS